MLHPGSNVTITGLVKHEELNGALGEIVKWDASAKRWKVQVIGGDLMLLKERNLIKVAPQLSLEVVEGDDDSSIGVVDSDDPDRKYM